MAASRGAIAVLLLLLLVLVAVQLEAADDDATTTHLHFFMHDIVSGSNPTAVQVIKGPASSSPTAPSLGMSFGDTTVIDDPLTETSSFTASPVGRMQGLYMLSSQSGAVLMVTANILLTSGEYNGSTIAVIGRDDTAADVRELSVVGGTGKFRMASGYVLWKTTAMNVPDATVELDVYLAPNANNGTDIDGGGSSSGSKSSSSGGATMMTRSFGGKWVVGVAAAVLGSWWVCCC
ncbi:hypothetical protein QOZ80_7AG0552320 [Eleusine coracana subsp. coracana]|nr:hypothetical protein QOZ80_7AG0552320 [Eleusine coracana subsp. coracana]